jgi:hypothetical protein
MQPTLHATREKVSPLTSTPLPDQQSSLGIVPKPCLKRLDWREPQREDHLPCNSWLWLLVVINVRRDRILHTIKRANGQHLIVTIDQCHLQRMHFSSRLIYTSSPSTVNPTHQDHCNNHPAPPPRSPTLACFPGSGSTRLHSISH